MFVFKMYVLFSFQSCVLMDKTYPLNVQFLVSSVFCGQNCVLFASIVLGDKIRPFYVQCFNGQNLSSLCPVFSVFQCFHRQKCVLMVKSLHLVYNVYYFLCPVFSWTKCVLVVAVSDAPNPPYLRQYDCIILPRTVGDLSQR